MSDIPNQMGDLQAKLNAARDLLSATKRNLQLVEEQIGTLQEGRSAVTLASDVSTEHRVAWLGAVDVNDDQPGIDLGNLNFDEFDELGNGANAYWGSFGFQNAKSGILRNQEDAAFVCTDIFVALQLTSPTVGFSNDAILGESVNPYLRLTDGNTGRTLITGMTVGPLDKDRGAVPFSYLSSIRPWLGANVKNKLFSEFTIPRAGIVRAEVFNLGIPGFSTENPLSARAWVSLFGFKVYGA